MSYILPTIVKLSDSDELPAGLRNHYMINLNIVGIKYFSENFIIGESSTGQVIMKETYSEGDPVDMFGWLLEDSVSPDEVIDIPRAYIVITEDLVNSDSLLRDYIINGLLDNSVFGNGLDSFNPGHDFYVNETLYRYLTKEDLIEENDDIYLPNYLTKECEISSAFEELTCQEKDYSNITYYYNKNKLADNVYTEPELRDFYSTFATVILTFTLIDDETRAMLKNLIYDLVLHYFANYKSDCATVAMNLILNTPYGSVNGLPTCGCPTATNSCQSGTSASSMTMAQLFNNTSCPDLYAQSMLTYLKTMLGDPEFYQDWFTISMPNGDLIPNDTLIDALEKLINEFEAAGFNIDFTNKGKKQFKCGCSTISGATLDYTKLDNFVKILEWLRNCQIDANLNKIKVYGSTIGELLPYMQY